MPNDLPVFAIKNGRLEREPIELREPTADSKERVAQLIEDIRKHEQPFQNLELKLTGKYRTATREPSRGGNGVLINDIDTDEIFYSRGNRLAYLSESRASAADGSTSQTRHDYVFDAAWMRSIYEYRRTGDDGPQVQTTQRWQGRDSCPSRQAPQYVATGLGSG